MSGLGLIREGLPILPRKLENSQAITQRKENLLKSRGRESDTQDHGGTCSRPRWKSLLELDGDTRSPSPLAVLCSLPLNHLRTRKIRIRKGSD